MQTSETENILKRLIKLVFTPLVVLLVLFYTLTLYGTTYFVATDGNNGNPGTETKPWKTIDKASQTIIGGEPVIIRAGTYNERVIPQNSGTFEYRDSASTHLFVVTNTHDSGEGSFRQAILDCNNHNGPDTIQFDIPTHDDGFDSLVWKIRPLTNLPAISDDGTFINGSSQTEKQGETNSAGPEVMLDGLFPGEAGNGLILNSAENTICGLIISGFKEAGIVLSGGSAHYNTISNCFLGTDESGSDSLGNNYGIKIFNGTRSNNIGSGDKEERNVISGNRTYGIYILSSDSNCIRSNFIGTNALGEGPLGNDFGIYIDKESEFNIVGGPLPGEGNVISGNSAQGLTITRTSYNEIIGNFIGSDLTGSYPIGNDIGVMISSNATLNIVGGSGPGEGNLISGNLSYGLRLFGTDDNEVIGNVIGLSGDGLDTLSNQYGILIDNNSDRNIIGGHESVCRNIISGNRFFGIYISGISNRNQIIGNWIGLNIQGDYAAGNGSSGIWLTSGASCNHIGPFNIVSGNQEHGIVIHGTGTDSNLVRGNWVGLDVTGIGVLSNNKQGIRIEKGARYNVVGGSSVEDRNVTSGNGWSGIGIIDDSTGYNLFQNNFCGTDTSGTVDLGNLYYGANLSGICNQFIGNLFSGNEKDGMMISNYSKGNVIAENLIGVQSNGTNPLPNEQSGIGFLNQALANLVGPGNRIWYNHGFGIELDGSMVSQTTITRNSITSNDSGGIVLKYEANDQITQPVILGQGPLSGIAHPYSLVEIFSDSLDQGIIFQDSTRADSAGNWTWNGILLGPNVTVTATDSEGNTSGFSNFVTVTGYEEEIDQKPHDFYLEQNFPNPFNSITFIRFGVKEPCTVNLIIANMLGQKVITLIDRKFRPGEYQVRFNAFGLPSGIYLYRVRMGNFRSVKKMVVIE